MSMTRIPDEKGIIKGGTPSLENDAGHPAGKLSPEATGIASLQQKIGNRAVQRMIAQRSDGTADLDEETTARINRERSGGQPLGADLQNQMGTALGYDFSPVRVHTSPESDELNDQINAKAFTSGQDIFFQEGAYNPHDSQGQALIAHELTHVVQQSSGQIPTEGSGMRVNPPGDEYEQEADTVAQSLRDPHDTAQVSQEDEETKP